ncbi:MAG: HMA2 domain-containing protein [Thermodesulfobacteriota bacterium]
MAPLSILPGRIRLATKGLMGRWDGCCLLEGKLRAVEGVTHASANPRTGRILISYDETLASRDDIENEVRKALQDIDAADEQKSERHPPFRRRALDIAVPSPTGHVLMDVALHVLLPAPLDLLLPAAATLLRR